MMRISILAIIILSAVSNNAEETRITVYGKLGCDPICSCFLDGIFYDEGDKFQRKNQPCTTYQCKKGFYVPIFKGCDFKGSCKEVGTEWTEGCMHYKCRSFMGLETYSLVEGGCADGYGNCIPVGERVTDNCVTRECQILGSCYKMTLINKGCPYNKGCQPINSYWHNGCTIFGCEEESEMAKLRVLEKEIMYWPEGSYSLLMPKEGCPVDIPIQWRNSSLLHTGDGRNYVSEPFDLYGNYTETYFDHHFCTHRDMDNETLNFIPRYQTYWDVGKYCILRKNDSCPKDFKTGAVKFDDKEGTKALIKSVDFLPDGHVLFDTAFVFCCRSDGYIEEPIILPKEHPFVLFMADGANGCQEVRGMTHEIEYFSFDNTESIDGIDKLGSTPEIKDEDNNTLIYFCYYKPFECGCTDDKGGIIKIGQNITKNCTQYRCERIENGPHLVVLHGGCKDEDECRHVGYPKTRGCYVMTCSLYKRSKEPYFRLKKAGCSNGEGECVPLGHIFRRKCMTYKCRKEPNRCDLEFLAGGCNYNGVCRDVNETWTVGCRDVKCFMERKEKERAYLLRVETVHRNCSYKGKCYGVGETLKEGCHTYMCIFNNITKKLYMDITDGGCLVDNECKKVNTTWRVGCSNYTCQWKTENNYHYFRKQLTRMRCTWNKKCYDPGDVERSHCVDFKCFHSRTKDGGQSAHMKQYNAECKSPSGDCIPINATEQRNCISYQCKKSSTAYPKLQPIKFGCKVDNVCKDEGMRWTDDKYCIDLQCKRGKKYSRPYPQKVKSGCKIKGVCKSINESDVDGCYSLTCKEAWNNGHQYGRVDRKPNGCMDNGVCQPFGHRKSRGCFHYECGEKNYQLVSRGCAGPDKQCHDVDEVYLHKSPQYGSCVYYKCTKTGRSVPNRYGCLDADGVCREAGDKGFNVDLPSRKMKNCDCLASGNRVRLQCRG